MKLTTQRSHGFTLVEIMIVVAIIGLLAAIAVPNFVRARSKAQQNACINNLKQMDGAKAQWAIENKKVDSDAVTTSDITPYLKGSVMPQCPSSGAYAVTTVSAIPTCTLSTAGHTL